MPAASGEKGGFVAPGCATEKAKKGLLKTIQNHSEQPLSRVKSPGKKKITGLAVGDFFLAQREGFEPSDGF